MRRTARGDGSSLTGATHLCAGLFAGDDDPHDEVDEDAGHAAGDEGDHEGEAEPE